MRALNRRVLLSVRPRFAHALLSGRKTAEVRRRFPELEAGTMIFVYASSPTRAVLGTVQLGSISRIPAPDVWSAFGSQIEISRDDLSDYLAGSDQAAIIEVDQPEKWPHPVPLLDLRTHVGVEPAQSFRYLDREQSETLTNLGAPFRARPESVPALSPAS